MKVASVIFKELDYKEISKNPKLLLTKIRQSLEEAQENLVEILVFPALIGNFYNKVEPQRGLRGLDYHCYQEELLKLSLDFGEIAICPGSWWEKENQKDNELTYHSSGLIRNGHLLLKQRQLYLARWERQLGLSRGTEISTCDLGDFIVCIEVSTDVFYPQVSRYAALSGVNLVLAPTAIKGPKSIPRQLSGLWQQVQQNLFFAVESGFKGSFNEHNFYSDSLIHAPLAMTQWEDGFLTKEDQSTSNDSLLIADISLAERESALDSFNPLNQLNPDFYKKTLLAGNENYDKITGELFCPEIK